MKTTAVMMAIASWVFVFFPPRVLVGALLTVFFSIGGLFFLIAGAFSYWWDSGMQPSQKSAVILVSGIAIMIAQIGYWVRLIVGAAMSDEHKSD
jgi:hypothetical protein